MKKNIVVVGSGYVGLSNSILLSQIHNVTTIDIDKNKVDMINRGLSPIVDKDISYYLKSNDLNLKATLDYKEAYKEANVVIICTPTDYNVETNKFDTTSIEKTINDIIDCNSNPLIIIKSTVPIGFTDDLSKKHSKLDIVFSPEFLREGKALYDNLYPSRIIFGLNLKDKRLYEIVNELANIYVESSLANDVNVLLIDKMEAESVKLFSNSYLALRVSYFNELDTFASTHGLNSKQIIDGVCMDPRIGDFYNNPSFGYGGYCLPKDTKQLLANYDNIPQNLIKAIVDSNNTRKEYVANDIISKIKNIKNPRIGVYRLTMKSGSDNFRASSMIDVIGYLHSNNYRLEIYEPTLNEEYFGDIKVNNDLNKFKKDNDLIICNRIEDDLSDVINKIYTRDLFDRD